MCEILAEQEQHNWDDDQSRQALDTLHVDDGHNDSIVEPTLGDCDVYAYGGSIRNRNRYVMLRNA